MTDDTAPMIVPNASGWSPSERVVDALRKRARRAGFYTDWHFVLVLEDGDLMLCREDEKHTTFIASKRKGRWQFFTDTYQELRG